MSFADKSSTPLKGLLAGDYTLQAVEAMRCIHNSFVLMAGKLKTALEKKRLTQQQYQDWLNCFNVLEQDWIGREVKTIEDVLFLQYMAQNSMEEARKFRIEGKVSSQ
ncbi:MAG: hypothetical protein JST39_06055 [Bacteroidetes bacterium]|nr:hypothetical protein [Bacteroidota bacterium]